MTSAGSALVLGKSIIVQLEDITTAIDSKKIRSHKHRRKQLSPSCSGTSSSLKDTTTMPDPRGWCVSSGQ